MGFCPTIADRMFRLPRRTALVVCSLAICHWVPATSAADSTSRIQSVRFWSFGDVTRVVIDTRGEYHLHSDQVESPARLFFDLRGLHPLAARAHGIQAIPVNDRLIRQIRIAETTPGVTRIVFDLEGAVEFTSSQLVSPDRLVIEIKRKKTRSSPLVVTRTPSRPQRVRLADVVDASRRHVAAARLYPPFVPPPFPELYDRFSLISPVDARILPTFVDRPGSLAPPLWVARRNRPRMPVRGVAVGSQVRTAPPIAALPDRSPEADSPLRNRQPAVSAPLETGEGRSLVRVFGLKFGKVVIDPGHGGHDTGTIGPGGLMEKELVLDVALRLGRLLERRLSSQVIYTRSTDTFIPLETRTEIANNEKADLFISIHANSSAAAQATGVETYYFNFTTDRNALDLATRENAASRSSIHDLNDLLRQAVLKAKVTESREFAQRVQTSLYGASVRLNRDSRDRGVRRAPFMVLIGATMPSILTEIGFVSNPHDERLLRRTDQRQHLAEALFKGVSEYAATLGHVEYARVR